MCKQFVDLVHNLRNTGIKVSDRRAVKIQNLIAASAIMCGRAEAILSDLWVLKYIWDTEEQIEILAGIIDSIIEKDEQPGAHPKNKTSSKTNSATSKHAAIGLKTKNTNNTSRRK